MRIVVPRTLTNSAQTLGQLAFLIIHELVEDIVLVNDLQLAEGMQLHVQARGEANECTDVCRRPHLGAINGRR